MKRVRRWVILGLITLAILVSVIAWWVYQQLNQEPLVLGQITGDLVFMSDRDGDWDIYLLDQVGELHNLTAASDAHEYYPNFTFDGEQVSLFSTATGEIGPARVKTDGTDFETLTVLEAMLAVIREGRTDWDPVWNSGGDRFAWTRVLMTPLPQVDLFVADANGNNSKQVTDDSAIEVMHAWSPDGTQLVYVSDANSEFNNTYVVQIANGTITRLTNHDASDYQPSWSMDGSQILVSTNFSGALIRGEPELYVMNADGSNLRPLGADDVFIGDLTYAPDGETVAYVSNESGYWHIYLMDADGSNVRRITEGESNNLAPTWRPVPIGP